MGESPGTLDGCAMSDTRDLCSDDLSELIGEEVVIDVHAPYLYLGVLQAVTATAFVLVKADVHFIHESQSTSEVYIQEAAEIGITPTREKVYVMRRDVVSISRLQDVIVY
jgi:hypothetical protein